MPRCLQISTQNAASASSSSSTMNRFPKLTFAENYSRSPLSYPALDAPFSYKAREPIVIDTFAPRPTSFDMSPTTSCSSGSDFDSSSSTKSTGSQMDAFLVTRSRVVRLFDLPERLDTVDAIFRNSNISQPVTMWISQDRADSIWAVFRTHQEACAALSASGPYMTVTTALETDLEPFQKFKRVAPSPQAQVLRLSTSHSELSRGHLEPKTDYTISSNPPNPRNSFRSGDWICNSPNCAAHNFGRNLACIGCGSARSPTYPSPIRAQPSPRFLSTPPLSPMSYNSFPSTPQSPSFPSVQSKGAHPLLTPSGRGFAVGGKVQNISSDPLSPCIMYWPDNEPFPEQGQIRPSNLVGVPQPPILNTGNRGPISHQPGDWVCQKCNYLNWRRRKVCQTCLPYAEGNGDSISAAVQAERIALLTSVLSQTHLSAPSPPQPRSQSMTPPQVQRSFIDVSPPNPRASLVHRSQSHIELGAQYANARPIYQTSGHRHHQSSPLIYTTPTFQQRQNIELHAPAPLLPSFLQDIVQSPTHSPSSTSSADLSFDEYGPYSGRQGREGPSSNNSSSIWRMDGEESKSLSAFPLRLGGSRSNSQERFRD